MLGAVELLEALDGQVLDLVDDLLALVVAAPGVALGVLVVQDAAARLEHRRGRVVLAGDEADGLGLSRLFPGDEGRDLGGDPGELGLGHLDPPARPLSTGAQRGLQGAAPKSEQTVPQR